MSLIIINLDNLKNIMLKNNFSSRFTDRCVELFLDKLFSKKKIVHTVPKKVINISLPFMGKDSLKIRGKIQVMFNSGKRLGSFFSSKDKVPLNARSLVLYKFTCSSCNSAYIDKTKRHTGWFEKVCMIRNVNVCYNFINLLYIFHKQGRYRYGEIVNTKWAAKM